MSNVAANRERTVRSIEQQLRGVNLTPDQASRLYDAIALASLSRLDPDAPLAPAPTLGERWR